jgi:nucleoside-diphosphate-sugar epimerase
VRVSNVLGQDFGSGNFIFSLIDDALKTGRMVLQTALESEKNYVHIDDVVDMIYRISQEGTQPVYNLAGGQNLTNAAVIEEIRAVIPANVEVMGSARTIRFAPIDISLAVREFGFSPRSVRPLIRDLAREYRLGSSF